MTAAPLGAGWRCEKCHSYQPPAWCEGCDRNTGEPQETHDILLPNDHDRERARSLVPDPDERTAAILQVYYSAPSLAMGGRDLGYAEREARRYLDEDEVEHLSSCLYAIASASAEGEDDGRPKK